MCGRVYRGDLGNYPVDMGGVNRGGAIVAGYVHLVEGPGANIYQDDRFVIDVLIDVFRWAADAGYDVDKCVQEARTHYRVAVIGEAAAIEESRTRRAHEGF